MKIKKVITNWYFNNECIYYALYPLIKTCSFFNNKIYSDEKYLRMKFKKVMGYDLNIKNPQNFNEKLQWLKINDRKNIYSKLVDKFYVREYIAESLTDGDKYLIPLVFETTDVKKLIPENLPDFPVIIKTNHDQGGFKIIKDKYDVNWDEIQKFFKRRLRNNFYWSNREWPYKNVNPRIIIEKLLITENGELPIDIKMHCFNGSVKLIQLSKYNESGVKEFVFLDRDYSPLPSNDFIECFLPKLKTIPEKYHKIEEMINMAEKFSKDIIYLRVDMYGFQEDFYMGEFTFYPTAGFIKYLSDNLLVKMGNWLRLDESLNDDSLISRLS